MCHSTVRALMKSCAPMSRLVCPARANSAISCCGVNSVAFCRCVCEPLLVAESSRRVRAPRMLGRPSRRIARMRDVARAGIDTAVLLAEPFAVGEASPAMDRHAGATEEFDGFAMEIFGARHPTDEGTRAAAPVPPRPSRWLRRWPTADQPRLVHVRVDRFGLRSQRVRPAPRAR